MGHYVYAYADAADVRRELLGGKGAGQGERRSIQHEPDTELTRVSAMARCA